MEATDFETQDAALRTILHYLEPIAGMHRRLSAWKDKLLQVDEPLTQLLYRRLVVMLDDLDDVQIGLLETIEDYKHGATSTSGSHQLMIRSDVLETMRVTEARMPIMMQLLHLYGNVARAGQDGALNALFAEMYIHEVGPQASSIGTRPTYDEGKSLRNGLELVSIVRDMGSMLGLGNPPFRLDTSALPEFRRNASEIMTRIALRSLPRYVESYTTLAQIPYTLDSQSKIVPGSDCIVRRVYCKYKGEPLAMKTMSRIFTERNLDRILREIGILEVCFHKNIVQLVEAFKLTEDDDHSDVIHLVMAPWAPFTLLDFLITPDVKRKKCCPWFQPGEDESDRCVYRIMFELSDALGYLHARSIKHKDLKPANILFHREHDREGLTPLITDVGVSKVDIMGATTKYNNSTYEYLAPEQEKKKSSTLRSDIWQLGCCFAELFAVARGGTLAGQRLVESFNNDREDCLCQIQHEHTYFIDALTELCGQGNPAQIRVFRLITHMLNLDPHSRPIIQDIKLEMSKVLTICN